MNMQYPDVESMICQMIMIGLKGSNKKDIANFMETLPSQDIGGVILYDEDLTSKDISTKNIIDSDQLKEFIFFLQSQFNTSLFIGIDQEGGEVNRLKNIDDYKDFESWAEIGKINEPLKTSSFAKRTAEALKLHGINLNFAPVLDLEMNPLSIIAKKKRCISKNSSDTIDHSKLFINEHRSLGIISIAKHFPGQGSAKDDTHLSLTDNTNEWSEEEILPYKHLIKDNYLDGIMTSHIINRKLDKEYPATLSKKILNGLLRKNLNFKGLIISDDPQMKAIADYYELKNVLRLMINAGVNLFCFGNNLIYDKYIARKVLALIKELLSEKLIQLDSIIHSYMKIIDLKQKYKII